LLLFGKDARDRYFASQNKKKLKKMTMTMQRTNGSTSTRLSRRRPLIVILLAAVLVLLAAAVAVVAPAPTVTAASSSSSPRLLTENVENVENDDDDDARRRDALWDVWHEFQDNVHQEDQQRPTHDYCGEYDPIHRDIPTTAFPQQAWQTDAAFMQHLLYQGQRLVTRAQEAILMEYGHGIGSLPQLTHTGVELRRQHMFSWQKLSSLVEVAPPPIGFERGSGTRGTGGWTTTKSWQGLVRRLLHAMVTNDEFVVVLGGHSAAAGHGNHFRQSYLSQLHRILVRFCLHSIHTYVTCQAKHEEKKKRKIIIRAAPKKKRGVCVCSRRGDRTMIRFARFVFVSVCADDS
jgi:hypothetical protein